MPKKTAPAVKTKPKTSHPWRGWTSAADRKGDLPSTAIPDRRFRLIPR
jgi:hypothetical protein